MNERYQTMRKLTFDDIKSLKNRRKITMLTAYDFPLAEIIDNTGVDMILVGDSLANVVLGLDSTKEVGMAEMLYHAKAVTRAVRQALVVGDMPYGAYQVNPEDALPNARRFIVEAGCDAVKIEWFAAAPVCVECIAAAGIPVIGHIGLTPQTAEQLGGFKVQGKNAQAAHRLLDEARELEACGCFCIILECVPDQVARIITKNAKIPTVGIGAGPFCDGQVLVTHDMLGLWNKYPLKFVKKFAHLAEDIRKAVETYKSEVERGTFPDREHSFAISAEELKKLETLP